MTQSSLVRALGLTILLVGLLFSSVTNADGGVTTDKLVYGLDVDEYVIAEYPDTGDITLFFWIDTTTIPTQAQGASGTNFPVGIGIFDPGVWAMAVVADTTDCSSLSFADCQAEGGYVGSTVFGIAETGPVSNTNQSTLAAGLMVMLTAMIVAGYGTFKIINP